MQIPLANIHWRFLLVRDDWGFQVNPLCRHDITRSDRQIGKYNYVKKVMTFQLRIHCSNLPNCKHEFFGTTLKKC